ncbi:cytochrome C oxidase [Novimethylophilus kurashikiensis]|uniref:Cytochrome C oxidase n=1 Tax=Novimethylophilus kurashikiensis TaxID=1825523 RepID=A0A2R5FB24_9PROT|nr:alkaline phosphatase family protein [Novimethylophilus kurashikiensis]GBG15225.1 cytochrome C oxidase [Novimethylophilus kurashikiensis]
MRFLLLLSLLSPLSCLAETTQKGLEQVQHIIVIYLENHGFDNLYGRFPNADGLPEHPTPQTDPNGQPYVSLPPVMNTEHKPAVLDSRFPSDLPNRPFPIDRYVPPEQKTGDLVHRFYQNQAQIHGGLNDRFAAISDAGGLAMGYYDGSTLPLRKYAQRYTLADHFFQGAFGGSFLNHFWLVCACTPRFDNATEAMRAVLDKDGRLIKDGAVTPDGYAVNTLQPATIPFKLGTSPAARLPLQPMDTIGDRLSENGIAWAWYSGGWQAAIDGHPGPDFQFHHQPFGYFSRYAEGTPGRAEHLKDEAEFLSGIDSGHLPAVAFYKPIGELNEHPGYADLMAGEQHIAELLGRIEKSPLWHNAVVIVTYDENGGFWDHVAPPAKDRWGPGTRVPTLVISPWAKRSHVDHTEYDTTSILKLIETRFGLQPLGTRDENADGLSGAFDFDQPPD